LSRLAEYWLGVKTITEPATTDRKSRVRIMCLLVHKIS